MVNRLKNTLVSFHQDEEGMEALQIIMVLAIAAMVVLGVNKVSGIQEGGQSGIWGSISESIGGFLPDIGGLF